MYYAGSFTVTELRIFVPLLGWLNMWSGFMHAAMPPFILEGCVWVTAVFITVHRRRRQGFPFHPAVLSLLLIWLLSYTRVRFISPVVDCLLTAKVVIQTFSSLPCLHGNHYWKDHWQVIQKGIFLVEIKIKSSQFINTMSPFFVNEYIGTCFT